MNHKMQEEYQHILSTDAIGHALVGSKSYKMHLQPNIPASDFWSVIIYDNETNLIIRNDQSWPSVHSNSKKLLFNQDGSVDIWFGPKAPTGKDNSWVQTKPGKGWHMILRLYYPLQPLFDKSWEPGEIEEIK
jgi:hypothetical protein